MSYSQPSSCNADTHAVHPPPYPSSDPHFIPATSALSSRYPANIGSSAWSNYYASHTASQRQARSSKSALSNAVQDTAKGWLKFGTLLGEAYGVRVPHVDRRAEWFGPGHDEILLRSLRQRQDWAGTDRRRGDYHCDNDFDYCYGDDYCDGAESILNIDAALPDLMRAKVSTLTAPSSFALKTRDMTGALQSAWDAISRSRSRSSSSSPAGMTADDRTHARLLHAAKTE